MQKKFIAVAIAGLMSGAAFAQTSVTIGGKVDAGYQFARSANNDNKPGEDCNGTKITNPGGGACGGKTTETLADGSATSSRITVVAKEDIGSGVSMEVNMDLRFGGGYHATKGGITTNDKKVLILRTPILNALWGVSNLGGQIYFGVGEKPYMISPKDLEIVKYGISQLRESSLTSRNTTIYTNPINIGPAALLLHATYAFGDNRTAGANNTDSTQALANSTVATATSSGTTISGANGSGQTNSGDVGAVGFEWKVGDIVNGGVDFNARKTTSVQPSQSTTTTVITQVGTNASLTSSTSKPGSKDGMQFTHTYVNIKPVKGLKLGASFNTYKGYDGAGGDFNEKNTNFVVAYNLNDKVELGVEVSSLKDLASSRNSGSGIMFGGAYFLSKSTFLYASHAIQRFDRNQTGLAGKYDGTSTGFTTTFNKVDSHLTKVGIVKEF